MSTDTTNPPATKSPRQEQYEKFMHNFSWGAVIICPLIIALPPRKLDFYTFSLIGGTVFGADRIMKERTGRGVLDGMQAMAPQELPTEQAREMQAKLKEAKLDRWETDVAALARKQQKMRWETDAAALEREQQKRSVLQKVWMGNEKPDWKEERDRKEKEALEEGRGYGDLILDQIWDVWNWGKDKAEEVKEVDEKVVEAKKEAVEDQKRDGKK